MADGINLVVLGGNIGSLKLERTSSGKPVLNISMATTESYFDNSTKERKERVSWHRVVIWDKHGEALSKILKVGMGITVQGQLSTRSAEKDGVKRWFTDVVGKTVVIGGSGSGNGKRRDDNDSQGGDSFGGGGFEDHSQDDSGGATDDIPFLVNECSGSLFHLGRRII